jgi:hypothetical protein
VNVNIRSNKLPFEQAMSVLCNENLIKLIREVGFIQFISPDQIM